jgi:hypothetical protein
MTSVVILGANPLHRREHEFLANLFEHTYSFGNVPIPYIKNHYQISIYDIKSIIQIITELTNIDFQIFSRVTGDKIFARYLLEVFFQKTSTSYHVYKSAFDKSYMRLFFLNIGIPTTEINSSLIKSVVKPTFSRAGKVGVKYIETAEKFLENLENIVGTGFNLDVTIERRVQGQDYTLFLKINEQKVKLWRLIREKHSFVKGNLNIQPYSLANDLEVYRKIEKYAKKVANYCGENEVITLHFKFEPGLKPIFYELGIGLGGDGFFENETIFPDWQEWF